jgi:hypothetical protein
VRGLRPSGRPLTQRTRFPKLAWLYRRATAARRPLPDFLVVGAQRCGTSWTYRRLAAHPSILRAWRKEVHFFDRDDAFARGPAWYRAHFPRARPGMITGEATPSYLFVPAAPPRLAALVPRARLVVLLRDPVDRAYSHYQLRRRLGREQRSFEAALDAQAEGPLAVRHDSYLLRGHYAEQLARLFGLFPSEQVLVLQSEALFAQPAVGLEQLLGFLGLGAADLDLSPDDERPYEAMAAGIRARLVEYFRPHNERLYDLLGRDLGFAR